MMTHWLLLVDLAAFSTGLSAFVLIVAQVMSEIGRFLVALIFLLLTFASSISVLDHGYFEMRDIPNSIVALFSITVLLFEDDYRTVLYEPALLTAVFLFVLSSSILLMNLLIAQLNNTYVFIYQDMVGFARLNRANIIVSVLTGLGKDYFQKFIDSLGFDKNLEFNQGDIGINGGIQVLEPANAHTVLEDTVIRFGGSCSEDLKWPEDSKADQDPMSKVEALAKKVLSKVTHDTRNARMGGRGGSSMGGSGLSGSKDSNDRSGNSGGASGVSGVGSGSD